MKTLNNRILKKQAAAFLIVLFLSQIAFPTISFALTGGPTQPEFSSFEPVATTNMVNDFTGDLTYNLPVLNIPGPDGGGYAMSLSYHSGSGVEDESSWVGQGWTLNPGAITRNKRGFADDWNNKDVHFYNKTRPNRTITLGGSLATMEAYSVDYPANLNGSVRYNNYRGFGYSLGLGISTSDGIFSLGFHLSDGTGSFSAGISPGKLLNHKNKAIRKQKKKEKKAKANQEKSESKQADTEKTEDAIHPAIQAEITKTREEEKRKQNVRSDIINTLGKSGYGMLSIANSPSPQVSTPFEGSSIRFNATFQMDAIPPEISPLSGLMFGSLSTQENIEKRTQSAYGYMYSIDAWNDNLSVMDYDLERPSGFQRYDKVLPVPSSSIDTYYLSGEGLGGGFRMHNSKMGHYTPSLSLSTTTFLPVGIDLDVGLAVGGGADAASGTQALTVDAWGDLNQLNDFSDVSSVEDESVLFRFTNDLASSIGYGAYGDWNEPYVAGGSNDFEVTQSNVLQEALPLLDRINRSSYIGYNTNSQINSSSKTAINLDNPTTDEVLDGTRFQAYCKSENIHALAQRDNDDYQDQIGEFSVVNEFGSCYNYGLPVYTKNEENIMVDISNVDNTDFIGKYIVKRKVNSANGEIDLDASGDARLEAVIGQYSPEPYASTYLLTSITTTDYLDRTNDGPTDDDFGGYTKFNYIKVHDDYRYRSPYIGMNYSRNSFSDPKDDMGGYISGEKQIYYLESIETKTHIAHFIKENRADGIEAYDRSTASKPINPPSINSLKKLKKLDRIDLYKKNIDGTEGKKIQTTHFQYNYSIQAGGDLLNSTGNNGKLTLSKVWTEYNSVYSAKIAPYTFEYEYPNTSFDGLGEGGDYSQYSSPANSLSQTAQYDQRYLDAWGNYQNNVNRYDKYQRWVDQSDLARPNVNFDPAMWQLKRIILPSGGEIHIQYEMDDYTFVQHEVAHTLVSLSPASDDDNSYFVNLYDVGITDPSDIAKYADQIRDMYVGTGKKMYYKFFYKLLGFSEPQLDDCKSDYVKGYFDVKAVYVENGLIKIVPNDETQLPKQVCRDYVRTQRAGMLTNSGCNPEEDQNFADSDVIAVITNLVNFFESFNPIDKCVVRNEALSYLRIPIFRGIRTSGGESKIQGKRGGGLRVKRLLMYDNGVLGGQKSLYGTEYFYLTQDYEGNYISSGVATNEPSGAREENPMVTMMERFKQTMVNRLIAGKDKKQLEGPIGENVLPGPSVGYSKIFSKNIHSGNTHTGYSVKEFYTAYDCPFYYADNNADPIASEWAINRGEHMATEIDDAGTQFPISIPAGIVNFSEHIIKARQGFNFALNNMHGQIKSSATFSNLFDIDTSENQSLKHELDRIMIDEQYLVAKEVHSYFYPGQPVPTRKTTYGPLISKPLGVEQDVCFETKHIQDQTTSTSIEGDAGVSFFGIPIPFIAASPSFTAVNNEIYTHVTTKITNYPAIERSVSNYQDGIWHTTLNKVFDFNTGLPIETVTYDDFVTNGFQTSANNQLVLQGLEHNASLTNYKYTAPMVYKNMGPKAQHENRIVLSGQPFLMDKINDTEIEISPNSPAIYCLAAEMFPPGSLIQLNSGFSNDPDVPNQDIYHIDKFLNGTLSLLPVSYSTYTGSTGPTNLRIVRSGKTNQLTTSIGNVTVYGDPNTTITASNGILTQMENMANSLTANHPTGEISGATMNSNSQGFDLFFNGACQDFPTECGVLIENGELIVQCISSESSGFNLPCNEISPYIVDYLNQYWDAFLMPVTPNITDENLCKSDILGDTWKLQTADAIPPEITTLENSIFNQPIHPSLINTGTDCDKLVSDYFKPIHRSNEYPILKQFIQGSGTNIEYRNAEIIIKDLALDQYYVIIASCKGPETIDLYYGVTQDSSIEDPISDYSQMGLEHVVFSPLYDTGGFHEGTNDCMYLRYPDDITSDQINTPISEVSTLGLNCSTTNPIVETLCVTDLTDGGLYDGMSEDGEFGIDVSTGDYNLVYYPYGSGCNTSMVDVTCLSFCDYSHSLIENVVTSSFSTYDDNWEYNHDSYASTDIESQNFNLMNSFETGERGKWRAKGSFVYLEDRGLLNEYEDEALVERNYNTGVYDLLMFDWLNPDNYNQYKKTSTILKYSPSGSALEEENIIEVRSSAKYGYNHLLPYMVAQNADYSSILFETFENVYGESYLEDGLFLDAEVGDIIDSEAHSGEYCLELKPTNDGFHLIDIIEDSDLREQGGIVKLWLKSDRVDRQNIGQDLNCNIIDDQGDLTTTSTFVEIARSGDWGLYEARFESNLAINSEVFLKYNFYYPNELVLIDDLRVQPLNAQVNTYVYDLNSFNLIASFDDQNFGLFYQYNSEGKLVRKLKETVKGMKTIKETQYNVPKTVDVPW